MGADCCHNISNRELLELLQKDTTGSKLKLTQSEKDKFIEDVKGKNLASNDQILLKPEGVHLNQGFLYKKDKFLYQGTLKDDTVMDGKGRITLIEPPLEYQGQFSNGLFSGRGRMQVESKRVELEGNWVGGYPEQVNYKAGGQTYHVSIVQPFNPELNSFKATISYPNGSKYHGKVKYDEEKQKFSITGQGKLRLSNFDTFYGMFEDGFLQGTGEFHSEHKGSYKGNFKKGKFSGEGIYEYRNGDTLDITWIDNKPHGNGFYKLARQETELVYFEHGKLISSIRSAVSNKPS